jgi:hypothetical protein
LPARQKETVGQDTESRSRPRLVWADHPDPCQRDASPVESTATQNDAVAHETLKVLI